MTDKYQNRYRIPSARWQNWDYRWAGAYYITICCRNRDHVFGEVVDGAMNLSGVGILADVFWHEIKNHSKNVDLGEFVVMPDHVHGILVLKGDGAETGHGVETGRNIEPGHLETGHALSVRGEDDETKTIGQQRFQNIGHDSVSSIIGSYKSAVTRHAHRLGFALQWQERFNDRVIRDDEEYRMIADYIRDNPAKWEDG